MRPIVVELSPKRKNFLQRCLKEAKDWRLKRNIVVILNCAQGHTLKQMACPFHCSRLLVRRLKKRFLRFGLSGLAEPRGDSSPANATPEMAQILACLATVRP